MNFHRAFQYYIIAAITGFVFFYLLGLIFMQPVKAADSRSLDAYISENGGRGFNSGNIPSLSRTFGSNGLTEEGQREAVAREQFRRDYREAERFVEERAAKIRRGIHDDVCDVVQRTHGTTAALNCLANY